MLHPWRPWALRRRFQTPPGDATQRIDSQGIAGNASVGGPEANTAPVEALGMRRRQAGFGS